MDSGCTDKIALITGAAGNGMGRSIALTLAREGAKIVVNYRTSAESASAIVKFIEQRGGQAIAVQADVFDAQGCETLVAVAKDAFGGIDICIIGPGGGWHPESPDKLNSIDALADTQQELAPLYHLMPLVLPGMYGQKWGRVIGLAQHPTMISPAYAYNVGKAARTHAMLLMKDQAWLHGVTVNVIAPGPVTEVEGLDKAIDLCDHGSTWQQRTNITPQDIAEGVAFLCSEAGRYIAGGVLPYQFNT